MADQLKIQKMTVAGFKSFSAESQMLEFGDINILLGANGSGKSNLVSVFKMLNHLTTDGFQTFVAKQGGGNSLLHFGAKNTTSIYLSIEMKQEGDHPAENRYALELQHAPPDRLVITNETISFRRPNHPEPLLLEMNGGNFESGLKGDQGPTSRVVLNLLSRIRAYQFHDTSSTAHIRLNSYIDSGRYLLSDAGNLAAFLRRLKLSDDFRAYYDRMVRRIRHVMPQFHDFDLEPSSENDKMVRLNWVAKDSEYLFGPHQISDGSLRFMALCTLLLQPPDMLPNVLIIDEPELGLHPEAVAELAAMIRMASQHCQVIVATQSPQLVNDFGVEDLIVVEWEDSARHSTFRRLDPDDLEDWLNRYSLAELWEKNVLGGYP